MKILLAHNFYQQPGGEDEVFRSEFELLRSFGHEVSQFTIHNDRVAGMGRLPLLGATVWTGRVGDELREVVRAGRPEVVHFHNTFPLMSPAVYAAARAEGAAVVQTLHNYRLTCPGALLLRDGKACAKCVHQFIPWHAVVHGCYRGSRSATAAIVGMLAVHRSIGTYRRLVDVYIAPSKFAAGKLADGRIPAGKIVVKPNFVHPTPAVGAGGGGYAAFVGRLSPEKGVGTLLAAWERLGGALPLKIIGDGPLADSVKQAVARDPSIEWLGRRPIADVYDVLGRAEMLVCPSDCYETFGRAASEAFAVGTPVVASGHGAFTELVEAGKTGLTFRPGDPADLAEQVRRLQALLADPAAQSRVRADCRRAFEASYNGDRNHEQLIAVYRRAIASARRSAGAPRRRATVGIA
jgi:glycosyltransferase involved in cell wall biosynthesis